MNARRSAAALLLLGCAREVGATRDADPEVVALDIAGDAIADTPDATRNDPRDVREVRDAQGMC